MKRILLLQLFLITAFGFAQVGVNTTTPDPSSMLDISATNKGVLVPRVSLPNVTTTQLDGTNTAATGLLIWNTNAATTGGNGVGFYYFNGTQWMPITQTSTTDHDIYEVGGTIAPDAITDNKYTQGSLTIGTNTAATGVLDVDNATKTTSVDVNNTFATNPIGIDVNLTSNAAGKTGIKTQFNGTAATGNNSFIQNTDNMVGNTNRTAINNDFSGTSSSISTSITGLKNDFKSTSNYYAILYGVSNSFASTTNAWGYGMVNAFTNGGSTPSFGVVNAFNGTSTGDVTGFSNSSNNRSGTIMGLENSFSGTGDGIHFGISNFLNGTGTGTKYGVFNIIPSTAGGTHYGIYSDVQKSGSFAGYFLGNVSIGTSALNNYILPPSRGTNGQIMQTDGSGNVSWVTPTPTPTTDSDWFELGTTTTANNITDNIYTQGKVTVGSSTLSNGKLNVYNSLESNSFYSENTGSPAIATSSGYFVNNGIGTHSRYGIQTSVSGGGTGQKFGVFNNINTSSTDWQAGVSNFLSGSNASLVYGCRNDISTTGSAAQQQFGLYNSFSTVSDSEISGVYNFISSGGNGINYGTHNRILGNGNGVKYGTFNFISGAGSGLRYGNYNYVTGSGTNTKYGTYNFMDQGAGGIHYGLYSEALKTGSYAGYFLGNVSIGTTTTNNYILPPSRGTNGQTMQTDGSGNVTWVNSPTDTDDQGTDVFSLTGTTLNLSLQNDGVATQTVDLSSLKDADWYEVGGTNSPDSITDNKFTLGDISIGKITAASGKLDVDAALKNVTTSFLNNNTTTGSKWGIQNNVVVDTNNDSSYGISNAITGNADFKYGIYNTISGAITGGSAEYGLVNNHMSSGFFTGFGVFNFFNPSASHTGNYIGLHNEISGGNHTGGFIGVNNLVGQNTNSAVYGVTNSLGGTGSGVRAGVYNFFSGTSSGDVVGTETYMIATGTGNKYGERITIPNTLPGIHFGVYSDVTKTNSFAGYFLGKVSVGTNIIDNYILPPSRGLNGQIMQTDGAGNVSWADAPSDADWYEVGGLTPANSILDNIFTGGDVSIGKATAATGKVDIEADNKTMTLVLENNNASSGSKSGIDNNLTANANNALSWGILNRISGLSPLKFGVTNSYSTNNPGASITEVGYNNDYTSTGNVNFVGHSNTIFPFSTNSGTITGYVNNVTGSVTGEFTGFVNSNFVTTNSLKTGLINAFSGGGNGDTLGINNSFTGITNGEIIGVNTNINSSGTGLKYGEKITIDNTSGGIHCGIYADVTKANSYAGYFLGRVSIGNTLANNYILPASRGTNGQIMQTDAVGNVSWVNPLVDTDTDNQQIDVLSLTGDTLNISLQDDAVATQTLNLGAIDNQGTDVFSLTGNTLNLSLQNDGVATQTVDLSPLSNDWKLTGNAGTLSGTNFIGTTDAQDLDFRVNNVVKIRLTQQGQLSFVNAGGSVFVGINAGDVDDLTNNQNTFVGSTSGQFTTTGNLNTGIGHASLNANISGVGNSGLGKSSLLTNTTGSNNTGVGRLADVATSGLSNATAVGFNATVSVSDKVRLGSTTVTVVEGQVPYTNPSDARFKFNVQENVPGLDFIKKLKPVTYNFDTKKFDEHLNKNRNREEVATEDFSRSTAIVRTGFLAQDVEKICNDLGYNFDGLHIPDAANPTDNYGIAYSQFIMPIVKAVQEQQVIIETQKTELEQLKSELEKYKILEERIKALEQK
ncbi:tail fiber domain-containing protein [Flavobacterium sp.]|uniref:tail fiber domain-containing protein n=1 Tax=Flavobacterium sp. TaxID=239 RepID=UPI002B4AE531|nr:tail fiber domain-containing protein [Flavobacterium sp.]HLP62911.1 tail fiber domain-containing protein [Flavobacterium sp.]